MIRDVSVTTARAALLSKGFREAASDHEMFFFYLEGKKTGFWFKISRGARNVRIDEIRNNARALRTRGDDIYRMLSCEHDSAKTRELVEAYKRSMEG